MSTPLESAVARVAVVLRKCATAMSSSFGRDCAMHAQLGRALLADSDFEARLIVGYAAWRVGRGGGDAVEHISHPADYLPSGVKRFGYHAWLNCNGVIIDFTTYQLKRKAQELDAADGGHTTVEWCPDYLLLPPHAIKRYEEVQQAPHAGVAYYEARPELEPLLGCEREPDPEALRIARIVFANPGLTVLGPYNT
jgi:hypothetical protein